MVFSGVPFTDSRKLLGNSREEPYNNSNRCRLHVIAELLDGDGVLSLHVSTYEILGTTVELTGTR
jgi:hypothetical protein